jgi:hypothetical protein
VAIGARVASLQTTLGTDLGVAGFTAAPTLPTAALTAAEFETALADPEGPVGMLTDESLVRFRGDAEAGVALTLVDRYRERSEAGSGPRWRPVRFPTGERGE